MRVYFDNAATTYPKPQQMIDSMVDYMKNIGCNISRGVYEDAISAEDIVYETREMIAALFNFDLAENVCFTKNITESLNIIIKGLIKENDKVLVSPFEHNAVMRPLNKVKAEIIKLKLNEKCKFDEQDLINQLENEIKAVIVSHSSNVSGDILPIKQIGKLCKEFDVPFIVDSAQTAGVLPIDMKAMYIDCLCFTGHKGLLGPQGMGGFVISEDLIEKVDTFIEGGTGSKSNLEIQPFDMPDKYEAGTQNLPGIYGLNSSLKYLEEQGIETIFKKERELLKYFELGLLDLKSKHNGFEIIGLNDNDNKTAILSLDFKDIDNAVVSHELQSKYKIQNRCGLHCSPSAHKFYNTFPQGTVRFSLGHYNTCKEVDYVLESIKAILNGL